MSVRGLESGRRAALLTIECQNGVINPTYASNSPLAAQCAERDIVTRIARLAAACRQQGHPVFHNKLVHRPDWAGSNVNSGLLGSNRKRRAMLMSTPEVDLHPELGAADE